MRCKCGALMRQHGKKRACLHCGRMVLVKPFKVLQEGGASLPDREESRKIQAEAGW